QNIVSVLSRQWESRLAERQDENQVIRSDSKGRQPIANSVNRRVAPFNPRHRRSRSVGGDGSRWLEHQEFSSAPLGTVLTPKLKNRKSVTRLELKDTLKASNYLLHHQEATADGSVETKLYKQNIVSVLSRQWESRLAERQDENQVIRSDSKGRQPIANSVNRRVAPFNPRHRRSRSVGGDGSRWLEHQEFSSAPLGTVLTPKLKNRKSVTRLELKDTLKASNYLLHHQEATADGSVETKLYKVGYLPHAFLNR
ncbi:hypothetical protein AHF37_00970, partial [Paragonimus kellicotti]